MTSAPLVQELTREAVREVGERGVVLLPLGATEQHGPHLPVGTDTLHAEHVARAAAARVARSHPVAVAPALPYGYSPHHVPLGGTLSVSADVYVGLLCDLGESLAAGGCRRLMLVNGHGGNRELVVVAAREITRRTGMHVAACTWWAIAPEPLHDTAPQAARVPGHAGAFETSLVLALRPELVHGPPERVADAPTHAWRERDPGFHHERPISLAEADGFTDNPSLANAYDGRRALDAGSAALEQALLAFLRESDVAVNLGQGA